MTASHPIVLVTGAGSGIGRAAAHALADRGAHVIAAGRSIDSLHETSQHSRDRISTLMLDVRDSAAIIEAFTSIASDFGRIDALVNNAGVTGPARPLTEWTDADWGDVLETNLSGAFFCARAAFSIMSAQHPQGGRIVNVGSIAGERPRPHTVGYAVSKAGLTALTRALAIEGRTAGVSCGQIDIGNAATGLTEPAARGLLQPDGSILSEPTFDVSIAGEAIAQMCLLPPSATVISQTIVATTMPYLGRG